MTEISCEMCMDLMPLVHDGVASADSVEAVKRHIRSCPQCRGLVEGQLPEPSGRELLLRRLQREAKTFCAMVLMFGIFYGLMLTAGSGLFYNILIMPAIGAIGYYLFRRKSLYVIPGLLFVTHAITNALGLGQEHLDTGSLFFWTVLYCLFALLGTAIAALFHFALKKEEPQ